MAAPDTARVTVNCVAGTSGPTGGQCWIAGTSLSICSGATAARCAAARHGRAAARGEGRSAGGRAALPTRTAGIAAGWSLAPTSRGGTRRAEGPAAAAGRRCGLGRPPAAAAAAWAVAGRVHPPAAAAASGTGSGSDTAIVIIVRTARPLGAVLNAATTSAAATSGRRLLLRRPIGRGCYRTGVAALPIHAGRRRRRGRRRHLRRAARAHPAVAA